MTNERQDIFLLLSRCVDVCKEQWYVVAADQCHETRVIEAIHGSLLLLSIGSFVRGFARVNRVVRHNWLARPSLVQLLPLLLDISAHLINLLFGKEVRWIVKGWAIASRSAMTMMEIAVCGNMDIPAISN